MTGVVSLMVVDSSTFRFNEVAIVGLGKNFEVVAWQYLSDTVSGKDCGQNFRFEFSEDFVNTRQKPLCQ